MRRLLSPICFFVLIAAAPATDTRHPDLTPAWVEGDAGTHVASVPQFQWLNDGMAVLLDERKEPGSKTFEKLEPRTGGRSRMLDQQRALSSLRMERMAPTAPDEGIDWPAAFNQNGTKAVYLFDGDIFLLDLPAARFKRLTHTPEPEQNVGFSPDGTMLSFVRSNNLFTYSLANARETQLTRDGSETILNGTLTWIYWEEIFGRKDIAYWWSPDSHFLAYLRSDVSAVPESLFVDFEPVEQRVIRQRYPKPGETNPTVRVGTVDANSGETHWVSFDDERPEWILRVKWLPDSRRLGVETLNRPQTNLGLYFSDAASGAAKRILTETDRAWINVNDDLYFLKDGQHFLWASERDGYMHLYRYELSGRLVNQVTTGDWAMSSGGGSMFWVRQAVGGIDESQGEVYFTALKDSSVQRQLYRVKMDGSGLEKITSQPGTHRTAMSPDAHYFLDTYSNIKVLPSLLLCSADGAVKSTIAAPRPELLPAGLQYPQLWMIPAGDGFRMPAQIMKPPHFDATRKYPVILHIYGGPSAPSVSDSWQAQTLFDNLLAREGYVMVAIDNRAATAISKTLEDTLASNPSAGESQDLIEGVQWLKKQPWVDGSRVGVWGWSGGGTNTLNLMTRSTEFKAGIAGAPVTDWRFYDSKWAESLLKLPKDHPDLYESTSLVKRAGNLSGRLLLIYGTYDDNVHPQNEQAFMNALIAAGKPYEVELYPMRKHGFADAPARIHRAQAMINFWKKNL